jgi:hypothetical protein
LSPSSNGTEQHELDNLRSELETIRNENENLNKIINELNIKTERQNSEPEENIQVKVLSSLSQSIIVFSQ